MPSYENTSWTMAMARLTEIKKDKIKLDLQAIAINLFQDYHQCITFYLYIALRPFTSLENEIR